MHMLHLKRNLPSLRHANIFASTRAHFTVRRCDVICKVGGYVRATFFLGEVVATPAFAAILYLS